MTDIVERLRALAPEGMLASHVSDLALLRESADEIERLRTDPWKHGAESMRQAILQLLPGGQLCDPQQIADTIRAIALPDALVNEQHKPPTE